MRRWRREKQRTASAAGISPVSASKAVPHAWALRSEAQEESLCAAREPHSNATILASMSWYGLSWLDLRRRHYLLIKLKGYAAFMPNHFPTNPS